MSKKIPTVSKLILRSKETAREYKALLKDDEAMLSTNKVTGLSLNFPIAETCKPSKLCVKTCYYAKGGSSWPNSLKRQYRLLNTVKADPIGAALRLQVELLRKRTTPSFLRWNGGGDLFPESVKMLNHLASLMPDLPIWVVTRIPSLAAKIKQADNVFIHFSLDSHSGQRRVDFEALDKLSSNYFYSYQCDRGEEPTPEELEGISVVFYDCYKPPARLPKVDKDIICALNTEEDITGVCGWCRRCFNGAAVKHSAVQEGNHINRA